VSATRETLYSQLRLRRVRRRLLEGSLRHGYWKARYDTVFERAEALGLRFVGPQYPNGRQADPWPVELPRDSLCVPTFHHSRVSRAAFASGWLLVVLRTRIARTEGEKDGIAADLR
jgi:hypothetical protein